MANVKLGKISANVDNKIMYENLIMRLDRIVKYNAKGAINKAKLDCSVNIITDFPKG